MDIAKRLLDFGVHPPTVYFPIIVKEAMMIEPTENESKKALVKTAVLNADDKSYAKLLKIGAPCQVSYALNKPADVTAARDGQHEPVGGLAGMEGKSNLARE